MAQAKQKRSFLRRIRDKYRLIIYNDNTFEEVLQFRLSRLNLFMITGSFVLLLIVGVTLLIAFTSLREYIPGYPDGNIRRNIVQNSMKLDSLQRSLSYRQQYLDNINQILVGEIPRSVKSKGQEQLDRTHANFERSKSDSLLRKRIEDEEQFSLSMSQKPEDNPGLYQIHFFTPLKGVVTNAFDPANNHYGTDIVAGAGEVVKAVLEGIVVMADWTLETGYVIQILHKNNILSTYKHNANLLKNTGERVDAGEAIAIVGNSGEITTGPHLHFELWHNGNALDPEDYIIF